MLKAGLLNPEILLALLIISPVSIHKLISYANFLKNCRRDT